MATVRRFELHDYGNNSHKFWELHMKDGCYHTEYGRLSGFGRAGSRSKSGQKCDGGYSRAIAGKIKKGYVEVTGSPNAGWTQPAGRPQVTPPSPPKLVPVGVGLINWNTL